LGSPVVPEVYMIIYRAHDPLLDRDCAIKPPYLRF
jgi:hypothetical protein